MANWTDQLGRTCLCVKRLGRRLLKSIREDKRSESIFVLSLHLFNNTPSTLLSENSIQ